MRSVTSASATPCVVLLSVLLGSSSGVRAADNFVLLVNTVTGATVMRSDFPSTVWIDQYSIASPAGRLNSGIWSSLEDQNADPLADWDETSVNSTLLSESALSGATSFQNGTGFGLGNPFRTGSNQDLAFQYRLAGSVTPSVGVVSYVTTSTLLPTPVHEFLPAYEGFDYSPPGTDLLGTNGGENFSGPWGSASVNANYDIGTGSLSYPGLSTTGNHVTTASHSSGIGSIGRRLIAPLGTSVTTQYVSFVVRPEGTLNEGQFNGFFGLRLETASGGDLFVGKPGSGAIDQFVVENVGGTLQHASGTTVEVGEEYLLVLRADFSAAGVNDLFTLYVNPTPGAAEPASGTIKNDFDFGIFNDVFLYATGAFSIDEIRVGPTYADVVPGIPGDYNQNGIVDAADYTVWRDHLGQTFILTNENPVGATPGVVDVEDYAFWKAHFGESAGSGGGSSIESGAVPEPATWMMFVVAIMALFTRQERLCH
jgi:hypothetical protein